MSRHILFVTGKLAEPSLRRMLADLAPQAGFTYSVAVLPITVAALATVPWIARHLQIPDGVTDVVLPGLCSGNLADIEANIQRGPKDLRDLPEFFGQTASAKSAYGTYDIDILAEINHAPTVPSENLLAQAQKAKSDGADIIDLGCDPGSTWAGLSDAVKALRDLNLRVSVDTFNPAEAETGAKAGAELVLSVNHTNRDAAPDWGCAVVAVPDQPSTLDGLDKTMEFLDSNKLAFRVDPVIEPIGFGFAQSLGRYLEVRRRYPHVEMLMGVGNLTELTDVDSAGVNVMLLGFCQEVGIRSVLTTEVINWSRSSVRELDLARRLVYFAVKNHTLPKHLEPDLILLRDSKLREHGEVALAELAKMITDRNFRLFAERGLLHAINDKMHLQGTDPFELFRQMSVKEDIDPAHAFYLGYELAKAVTALTLAKNYTQDQALRWGFLTRPEKVTQRKPTGGGPWDCYHTCVGTTLAEPVAPPIKPLVEELRGISAWEVCLRLSRLPHLLFLDSAQQTARGRYSFVTADPFEWLHVPSQSTANPFDTLQRRLGQFGVEPVEGLPPFQGGAAGLFSYDLCHHLERLPRPKWDDFAVPDLAVGLYDWVAAFDHETNEAWLISTGLPETEPRRQQRRALRRLEAVREALAAEPLAAWQSNEPARIITPQFPVPGLAGVTSTFRKEDYLATARRAIEYVHAGDCFQVNLAQRLLSREMAPLELYGRLRERNPAPFAAYFDAGDFTLASASPERFLRVEQGDVDTHPIKGTRPRGKTLEEDRAKADELQKSAKDRAENVMIVDLLRNDLGRVCRYGSVRVEALCRLESFQYVHHLVSEVRGRLREDRGPIDLLKAAFPGGSITGAPKIRAMEIIAELEPCARGAYCGSLGYIGFDGSMDSNLLIRTFTMGKGWTQFSVGGGIVADSEPEREYEETLHKAEGMLRALVY